VPGPIIVSLNSSEPAHRREQRRRLRLLCPWLPLHLLLLLAQRRTPTAIADGRLCSRSSVYEVAHAGRRGGRPGQAEEPASAWACRPSIRRSLLALLAKPPSAYGWCRTRWSCATLAWSLPARRGVRVSAEAVRRWLHREGWRWKRAQLVAQDNDPQRASKRAAIRWALETLGSRQALLFVDELDMQWLPKVGYQWMPRGTPSRSAHARPKREEVSGRRLGCPHRCDSFLFRRAQNQCPVPAVAQPTPSPLSGSTLGAHRCGSR
jgi:transposase